MEAEPDERAAVPASSDARQRPPDFRRTWGVGVVAVFLLAVQGLSGLVLLFHYRPTTRTAYSDLVDLGEVAGLGFVSALHAWGSVFLILAVILHGLRVMTRGGYRAPRRANWTLGLSLLVVVLLMAWTGSLLPWDQEGYWAHATTEPSVEGNAVPRVLGEGALRRAFTLHVGVLPALAAILLLIHLRWARGSAEPPESR